MRPILAFGTVVLLCTAMWTGFGAAEAETTAVVDRAGDDYAVLLIETEGETTDQRVVSPSALDSEGRYEGPVHRVVDGKYVYDEAETRRRQTASRNAYSRNVV